MIKIHNLSKNYGQQSVLIDVSLEIPKGQTIAVIGPSGSGKSTLLRCINNLETPTTGHITIDGVPSVEKQLYQKIGMVFQHFNLFPHMDLLGNLIYAPVKVTKESKEVAIQRAMSLLAKVGLSDKATSYPNSLSGGQKQRAAIARTLMMQPEIVLFDEPTSALDPEVVKEVLEVIKALSHTGITILIVTHEMSFARAVADRILFFDQGKLLEDLTPEEFFRAPKTTRAQVFLNNIS